VNPSPAIGQDRRRAGCRVIDSIVSEFAALEKGSMQEGHGETVNYRWAAAIAAAPHLALKLN